MGLSCVSGTFKIWAILADKLAITCGKIAPSQNPDTPEQKESGEIYVTDFYG